MFSLNDYPLLKLIVWFSFCLTLFFAFLLFGCYYNGLKKACPKQDHISMSTH